MVKSLHFTIGNIGSIPGWRTKILHAPRNGEKKKKRERKERKGKQVKYRDRKQKMTSKSGEKIFFNF